MRTGEKKKIHFLCTNEWFFESHFFPLNEAALSAGDFETTLITKPRSNSEGINQLDINVLPLSFERSRFKFRKALKVVRPLTQIFRRERPDLIHFIALRPIVLGGLANMFTTRSASVYHLTGTGCLSIIKTRKSQWLFRLCLKFITFLLKQPDSFLIVENEDDLAALKREGKIPLSRTIIIGGAGVDPTVFNEMATTRNSEARVGFVGRMVWSKGIDLLTEAADELRSKDLETQIDLYGQPDKGNPCSIHQQTLEAWNQKPNVSWHGYTNDVKSVWAKTDIAVFPSRGGEGLPRSMLEAASCGRPLIVTDVPGCKHFVRNGIEGLVVPPEDPKALADAIEKLSREPELCTAMGKAARRRVLESYTEDHIRSAVSAIYRQLLKTDEETKAAKIEFNNTVKDLAA